MMLRSEVGAFIHSAENEMLCRLTHAMIPYFNAGIYLENKAKIGKVEEVLGPVNKVHFTIKPDSGVNPSSFKADDKVYIGTDKLLPLSRFTNEGKKGGGGGRGGAGRGGGGRGGPSRGFGGGRGPPGRGGGRGGPVFGGRGGPSRGFGGRGFGGRGRG
jgi:H/ACA ribonucleoprotein complex subunit 1